MSTEFPYQVHDRTGAYINGLKTYDDAKGYIDRCGELLSKNFAPPFHIVGPGHTPYKGPASYKKLKEDKIRIGGKAYKGIAKRKRIIDGICVPAGVDLCKTYRWCYCVHEITQPDCGSYEVFTKSVCSKHMLTQEEFAFFRQMWEEGKLKEFASTEGPVQVKEGYVTLSQCDGQEYGVLCALPIKFNMEY